MRELKFRAWDGKTKKMHVFDGCAMGRGFGVLLFRFKPPLVDRWDILKPPDEQIDNLSYYEIMPYTGLKEKNGKGEELYAGDIMKDDSPLGSYERDHPRRGLGVIVWDTSRAAWCLAWENSAGMKCRPLLCDMLSRYGRRIGNVHQNPELMK